MRRGLTALSVLYVACVALLVISCSTGSTIQSAATEHPSHVSHPPDESELSTVTLTEDAIQRLGIATTSVVRKAIRSTRTIGGELVVPPGRSVSVSAPVAGTLATAIGSAMPAPGTMLRAGSEVLRLFPIGPAGNDLVQREAEARARFDAAGTAARRAEQLLKDRAGSQKQLEQARAELAIADSVLRAVRTQRDAMGGSATESGAWGLTSPFAGRLSAIHVAPGQFAAAGTPLFDVTADDPLWVRIPFYAGDLALVDRDETATVLPLGATASWGATPLEDSTETGPSAPRIVRLVQAPPSANPAASTVDLFYSLDNSDSTYQPGQRVAVTLPLISITERSDSLVVPYSAVLYDIHGGTWVYENTVPREFIRRRVEVGRVVGELAVLARGIAPGARVVHVGNAELFGTEFGVGH